ncbi:transglycosylase family protein [Streptomyces caniscabiei]|uniref:transglycosylase family protein n=1 Tax=Streptomyces caniscabiei TaxID=2746961 RepID=UPI0029A720E2|nr:transglycosylase family protein [Streptomyces caniscabiei]MDX2605849.1 transglycosylase family protein [Streptomyces caniscabiei]MDX2741217.1 transglycosylase family protein [Streptomyces caniscabiei]MDX2783701.1 transglycosylase family protein [Streptomyces caniscabiei]
MLSGNGRHRRPRQAPALLVAAGVTGSAIAIPLLGATGASAASGTTWDQVAECESGGSWSADTGNGRYGGLQLTQANWEKYGGLEYATTADQASRSQQIAVAEKVLADQGVGVWATCGLLHNLGGDSGSADVDTGVADDSTKAGGSSSGSGSSDSSDRSGSSDSSDSSGSSDPSGSTSAEAGDRADSKSADSTPDAVEGSAKAKADADSDDSTDSADSADPKGANADKSSQSDDSSADEGEAGTGRHRGASADEDTADAESGTDAADGSRTADPTPSGRHASRGGDAAREAVDGAYTVRAGDSLTRIANSLDLDGGWRGLYAENETTVGADPDLILPGQTLEVGAETGEK